MVKVDLTEKVKCEQRLQIGKGESRGYVGGKSPRQRCKGPGAEWAFHIPGTAAGPWGQRDIAET